MLLVVNKRQLLAFLIPVDHVSCMHLKQPAPSQLQRSSVSSVFAVFEKGAT